MQKKSDSEIQSDGDFSEWCSWPARLVWRRIGRRQGNGKAARKNGSASLAFPRLLWYPNGEFKVHFLHRSAPFLYILQEGENGTICLKGFPWATTWWSLLIDTAMYCLRLFDRIDLKGLGKNWNVLLQKTVTPCHDDVSQIWSYPVDSPVKIHWFRLV